MRITNLLGRTLRENPADISHHGLQVLVRAGYFRPLGTNTYALLPLGMSCLQNMIDLLRKALRDIAAQEIYLPNTLPSELWKDTQRLLPIESAGLHDMQGRYNGMSHHIEEAVYSIIRREITSYKQLPLSLYFVMPVWYENIDEHRLSSFGHENIVFHLFNFDTSAAKLEMRNRQTHAMIVKFFEQCGLSLQIASSLTFDYLPALKVAEHYSPHPIYGKAFVYCSACGYRSSQSTATFTQNTCRNSFAIGVAKSCHA